MSLNVVSVFLIVTMCQMFLWEKTMARELKKIEIHKMKRKQEEEGEEDD